MAEWHEYSRPQYHQLFPRRKIKRTIEENIYPSGTLAGSRRLMNIQELYTVVYKIEDNANPYTFVWGYAFKTNKEKKKL